MDIVFYKNRENPEYYLLYIGGDDKLNQTRLQKFTNSGEYENSGYVKIDIEIAYIMHTDFGMDFFYYLTNNIATDYIEHRFYSGNTSRAWLQFKSYEPEKWEEQYIDYLNQKNERIRQSNIGKGVQTTLL